MYDGDKDFPETLGTALRLSKMSDDLYVERHYQERSIEDLTKQMEMMETDYEDKIQQKLAEREELRGEIVEFSAQYGRLWQKR